MKNDATTLLAMLEHHALQQQAKTTTVTTTTPATGKADVSFGGFFAHIVGHDAGTACALTSGDTQLDTNYYLLLPDAGSVLPQLPGPLTINAQGMASMSLAGWNVDILIDGALSPGPLERPRLDLEHGRPKQPEKLANWHALALVPSFFALCGGLALRKDWEQAPSIVSLVRFGGGTMSSDPMHATLGKVWTWKQGVVTHEQPCTDIVRYRSTKGRISLRITTRCGTQAYVYELAPTGGDVRVWLVGWPPRVAEGDERLDLVHLTATLPLCEVTGDVSWPKPTSADAPGAMPEEALPDDGIDSLIAYGLRKWGRPNCGGRIFEV